jgi:hypothetical protein
VAVRANSTGRRNTSMTEVPCRGNHETSACSIGAAGKNAFARPTTGLAARPVLAVLGRGRKGALERGRC